MAAIDFPDPAGQTPLNTFSPTSTPSSTTNGYTYVFDGDKWTASSSGGGGTSLWTRDGSTLEPANSGDDILGDGKIISGADSNNGANSGATLKPNGSFLASRTPGNVIFAGYTTGNSDPTTRITSDGDIIADGTIKTQGNLVPGYQSGTIVPDLRRWNNTDGMVEVPSSIQTPSRRNGRFTRVGDLVTYSFDWKGTIEWGVVNNEPWKTDEFVFTAPYANTADPYIQSAGVYRAWQTKIPHGDDTFCDGVISTAANYGAISFQEIFNNGAQATGASWDLWRCGETTGKNYEVQVSLTYFVDDTTWQPLNGATIS